MRRSRFTEQQIVTVLGQAESGSPVVGVCRKLGITEQTVYRWKRTSARMGVAERRRLREIEEENRRLKQLVAGLTVDKQMLQTEPFVKNIDPNPETPASSTVPAWRQGCQCRGGVADCIILSDSWVRINSVARIGSTGGR